MQWEAVLLERMPPGAREPVAQACFRAASDGHPLHGALARRYYESYFGAEYRPLDIVVLRQGEPALFLPLTAGKGVLSHFGEPARLFPVPSDGSPPIEAHGALRALLDVIGIAHPRLWIVEDAALAGNVVRRELGEVAWADLSLPESGLRGAMRKSYKSLVNWGLRHMTFTLVDRSRPDQDAFREMRDFHRTVAGRATRSDRTWDLQFEMIQAGEAYALLGRLEGRLAAATYVSHGSRIACYGVGVYDRALMGAGTPVGHASLFRAILHARGLGLREFHLGEVGTTGDGKLDNIALFKKGFATGIRAEPRVEIALAPTP